MNVAQLFARSRRMHGSRAALIHGLGSRRRHLSYDQLAVKVNHAAWHLQNSGLQPGDKVLLAVPLSIETYVVMLAILQAGLVIVFIDPSQGKSVVERCLRGHPPAAIVATRRILNLRWLSAGLRRIPIRFAVGSGWGRVSNILEEIPSDGVLLPTLRDNEDPALLTFTSGSTGDPKAVVRTHGFLQIQFRFLRQIADLSDTDIDLVAMPMFVLFNLANGITSVIPACDVKRPGRANPQILSAQINAEYVSRVVASPALLERLADSCTGAEFAGIRRISTGGGPVSPALPARLKLIAPGADIVSVYGSTEAEPIASISSRSVSAADLQRSCSGAGLLAGVPVAGCEVRIIQYRREPIVNPCSARLFTSLLLDDNCIGEIVVSGEHVLQGYADSARNAETKIMMDDTVWHRTGDAGYFDDRGRLWLAGRCSAAVADERGTVFPFQVEYAACNVDGIRRAALVADSGQRVLAVEPERSHVTDALESIGKNIPDIEIDRIVPLKRIPLDKRHDAKVDYPALRRAMGI